MFNMCEYLVELLLLQEPSDEYQTMGYIGSTVRNHSFIPS